MDPRCGLSLLFDQKGELPNKSLDKDSQRIVGFLVPRGGRYSEDNKTRLFPAKIQIHTSLGVEVNMPGFTCCVPGCYNNSHRDRELRFYTFPKDAALREQWLRNISRAGVSGCFSTFQPTTGHRVCSVHFAGGRKTYTIRVPSLFPLRGVNERRNRRGRGKKVSAPAPAPVPTPAPAATSGIIISNLSVPEGTEGTVGGEANNDEITVVQIGQNGEYLGTARLPAQTEGTCYSAPVDDDTTIDESKTDTRAVVVQPTVQYVSVTSSPLDHSYSLTTGTTSSELLRKLNEQRDIIALMEVKMKEMKATIRQLRVTEAKLQEEVRERDRLLVGLGNPTVVNSSNSRKKV
ncbi:hypothetical protein NQD34_001926 [Periophthalmus magnuspinnatus]|nr:hypothetical protein NQD34_001926 [Periophthalmus magnuspinnatus]